MINLIEVIIRLDYWKRWPQCFAFRKSIQIYDSLSVPISKLWDHIWLWSRKKWSRSQGRDRGVSWRECQNTAHGRSKHRDWQPLVDFPDAKKLTGLMFEVHTVQMQLERILLNCASNLILSTTWGMFRLFPDENRLWTSKLERSRRRFPESPDFSSSELWSPCRPELEHARLVNPLYES